MGQKSYLARRIVMAVFTLFVFATLMFLIFRIMPGDPTGIVESPAMQPEYREQLRELHGLNEPLYIQYLKYVANLATFNLGNSFWQNQPVFDIVVDRTLNSIFLYSVALIMSYSIGISLGSYIAWKRDSKIDRATFISAIFFRSIPQFLMGLILLYLFAYELGWFPIGHMFDVGTPYDSRLDLLVSPAFYHHLFLPAMSMVAYQTGYIVLLMRTSMLKVIGEPFIKISHARGLKPRDVLAKHATRNALLPVVTTMPISIGSTISGNVLVETIFSWPGIGRTLVQAVQSQDYPLAQGAFVGIALIFITGNLLVDILYTRLDPRITHGGESR